MGLLRELFADGAQVDGVVYDGIAPEDVKRFERKSPRPSVSPEVNRLLRQITGNVYCATGDGGGVDPTCSPDKGGTAGGKGVATPDGRPATIVAKKRDGGKPETLHAAYCKGPGCKRQSKMVKVKDKVTGEETDEEVERFFYEGRRTWVDATGKRFPKFIQDLGIMPQLSEVYVNLDPVHPDKLYEGRDAAGRKQPKYSAEHWVKVDAAKYEQEDKMERLHGEIIKELKEDRRDPDLADAADCALLVMHTGFRPGGGGQGAAKHKSYGATNLEGRHIHPQPDGSVVVRYAPGKAHGKQKSFRVKDPTAVKILKERAKAAGPKGRLFDITPQALVRYNKLLDDGGFKTKDLRTHLASKLVREEVEKLGAVKQFRTMKQYKKSIKLALHKAAKALGHEASNTTNKSYANQKAFAGWSPPPLKERKPRKRKVKR